jgi:hypothetical protein
MRSPMTPNRHRIQRQILELTVGDAGVAPMIQEQLARACREPLLDGMALVFDAVAPVRQLLRLEKLEINVGRIAGGEWAREFERRVLVELGRQLARHVVEQARESDAVPAEQGDDEFDTFKFFLRHGRLPWWGSAREADWPRLLESEDARRLHTLRALLREEPRAITRAANVLDDERLEGLVASFSPLRNCSSVMHELSPAASAALNSLWRRRFWSLALEWAITARDNSDGIRLVHGLLAERRALALAQSRRTEQSVRGASLDLRAPSILPEAVVSLPAPWQEWFEMATRETESVPLLAAACGPEEKNFPALSARSKRRPGPAPDASEAVYLRCAGVLLLHPFLETLFRDRALLDDSRFHDEEARARAAQLLGYLATGHADTPEYELGFAKLMVGMDIEALMETTWLDEADIAACDALLAAVLGHWIALRSTSAAWLRNQFLLRDGKLEDVDGGRRVTVERRAQDVLLARLPWGFGVISLPWLEERIFVRWLD